jgi:hypothetical protein
MCCACILLEGTSLRCDEGGKQCPMGIMLMQTATPPAHSLTNFVHTMDAHRRENYF